MAEAASFPIAVFVLSGHELIKRGGVADDKGTVQ